MRGLHIRDGGNLRWRSGRIEAPNGAAGVAADGYAVQLLLAADVRLDGVTVTSARIGVAIQDAQRITIADSKLWRFRADGINASRVDGLTITRNSFSEAQPATGDHSDALQVRNGVRNLTVTYNTVRGASQGLAQMDAPGDAALANVVVEYNDVAVDAYHPITFGNCINCRVRFNKVQRAPGSAKKARVIVGPGVAECGNVAQDAVSPPCL